MSREGKEKSGSCCRRKPKLQPGLYGTSARGQNQRCRGRVPIFWDDNYFSLLPGEKRQLSARFESPEDNGDNLMLAVDGWNVVAASSPLTFESGH